MREYWMMFRMIGKRLLCRKSFLICLTAILLFTVTLKILERETQTVLRVGIYAQDETIWRPVFETQEGLIQFYFCSSEEELVRDVVRGKAECGYVLQEDLQKRFEDKDWNWAVTVYKSPDTMLTEIINEAVYSRIFNEISSSWYEGYIANASGGLECEIQKDSSTFAIEEKYVARKGDSVREAPKTSIFPIKGIVFTGIFLCGLLGTMQAVSDRTEKLFRNRSRIAAASANIFLPAVCAAAVGFAALGFSLEEFPALLVCLVLVMLFCLVLQWIVRTREALAAVLPFLVFGSLIGCYLLIGGR